MFETISQKLHKILSGLTNKGRLSEKDIDESLRQIRLVLLEADVNFKVVKSLLEIVKEKALTARVLDSLTPGQQIIKIINEELVAIMGNECSRLINDHHPPAVILLVGLQGSGKTTTAAKLAMHIKHSGQLPLMVAADTRRPAAAEQLVKLGEQIDVPVFTKGMELSPLKICKEAYKKAIETAVGWLIIDTQGRWHIDEELIDELVLLKSDLKPVETLLIADAMAGQDAVNVAERFNDALGITGLILTKMDGDSRGGAALSIRFITGVPIKFIGVGEKPSEIEPFYPDRIASRILGMGDVITLIEKAEKTFNENQAKRIAEKMKGAEYSLDDFLYQLQQLTKMGTLTDIIGMFPKFSKLSSTSLDVNRENTVKKIEAIILSMTKNERLYPAIINGSRRRRIAQGSGTTTTEVNSLLNQFYQVQKLTRLVSKGKLPPGITNMFR
jgi:signal recognition particle subunit SRP54